MAIQFCDACGDTLPESKDAKVECECCGAACANTMLESVSVSSTDNFPSELRRRRTITAPQSIASTDTWGSTDVECRECRAPEVRYTALQLRGADEGTTIFFFCPACSARWSDNN